MGILDWLIGKDVTRDWDSRPNFQLVVDLDTGAFCGVREDQPLNTLSAMGPAEDRAAARKGNLHYYSKGVVLVEVNGRLSGFEILFETDEYVPFAGVVRWYGQSISLSSATTPEDVKKFLGPPEEEDDDEGEIELAYGPNDDVYFQVFFNEAGRLESIDFL